MLANERRWARWALAALVTALALFANHFVQPLLAGRAQLAMVFPSLLVVGFFAGLGPALASLAVSALVLPLSLGLATPAWHAPQVADVILIGSFVVAGLVGIFVTQAARNLLIAFQETRERLDMALAAGDMTTWEWELPTGKVTLARGAEAVFGARWSNIDEAWRLVHEDDRDLVAAQVRTAIEGASRHYTFVSRIVRPDTQAVRWLQTHGHIVRGPDRSAVRVTGVTMDVTARHEAMAASSAAQARFEVATRSSNIIVWECDRELRYTWVRNPQMGFRPEDFIGRRMGELLSRAQAASFFEAAERVLETGKSETVPVLVVRDAVHRHYLSSFDAKRDAAGRVVGLIGASVDVTQLKQAEESLKQEIEQKDSFVAMLAHELRNPMAPIRYAAQALAKEAPDAMRREAQKVIERQSAHMARLLEDLLDISRINRNLISLRCERMDLRDAVYQAVHAATVDAAAKGLKLQVRVPAEGIWINGDMTRIIQIISNLLDNAVKYTPSGGHVSLSSEADGPQAVVIVEDDGVGLPSESLSTAFQMFSRVKRQGSTDPGGLGIGLAVVKRLVELHSGEVRVRSDGPGKGAAFQARFPLLPAAVQPEGASSDKEVVVLGRGVSVLVVDDNVDAADMLAAALRLDGYAVSIAYNGAQAIEAVNALRPNVVLLDLGMPDIDGLEVASLIRALSLPLALIAVTGWGQENDRRQSAAVGFDAHLVKPVAVDEVKRAIDRLAASGGSADSPATGAATA
ncbi:MAG TPA: ATP-binding protein [Roseateles sp.]